MKANWTAWVLAGFGLLVLLPADLVLVIPPVRLLLSGERAQGVVVDHVASTNPKARGSQAPMVEFAVAGGARARVAGTVYSRSLSQQVGDAVTVLYRPAQPSDARLLLFGEFVAEAFFLGVTAVYLLGWIALPAAEKKLWSPVPGRQKELKTCGFPAVATVLEADAGTRTLRYRIDKDTRVPADRIPSEDVDNFISLERAFDDWKPTRADTGMIKGAQFRAYLAAREPARHFHVDFSDRIGFDPFVKSLQEEDSFEEEEEDGCGDEHAVEDAKAEQPRSGAVSGQIRSPGPAQARRPRPHA